MGAGRSGAGYVRHNGIITLAPRDPLRRKGSEVTSTVYKPQAGWLVGRDYHISPMRCCPSEADPRADQAAAEARERLRLTSLAYTDQMVTAERPETCPRARDRVVVELHSGQVFPDRCRSSQCRFCLPLNARRRCLAITLAQPTRMIRLSLVGDDGDVDPCRTALIRIKRTRQALKRMGFRAGEWCYTIERNPKETGFHAHCLQTGPYIPQDALQTACKRGGAGIPYINAIKREGIWTSRYGLKGFGADGYGLKTFRPSADPTDALKINNGRMEHHTRGFYSYDGEVLKVRDMERAAIGELNCNKPLAFVGMPSGLAPSVIESADVRSHLIRDANSRMVGHMRIMR